MVLRRFLFLCWARSAVLGYHAPSKYMLSYRIVVAIVIIIIIIIIIIIPHILHQIIFAAVELTQAFPGGAGSVIDAEVSGFTLRRCALYVVRVRCYDPCFCNIL